MTLLVCLTFRIYGLKEDSISNPCMSMQTLPHGYSWRMHTCAQGYSLCVLDGFILNTWTSIQTFRLSVYSSHEQCTAYILNRASLKSAEGGESISSFSRSWCHSDNWGTLGFLMSLSGRGSSSPPCPSWQLGRGNGVDHYWFGTIEDCASSQVKVNTNLDWLIWPAG